MAANTHYHSLPQQRPSPFPDYAGLEVVDHGGLEVVTPTHHSGGLEVSSPQPPHGSPPQHQAYGYPPTSAASNPYWDEGPAVSGYPPPSTDYAHSHYDPSTLAGPALVAGGGGGGSVSGSFRQEKDDAPEPRLCGMKRQIFWVLVAVGVLLVVLGVALGVGLGIGLRKPSAESAAVESSPTSTPTPSSSTSAGPSRTTSYPAPKATATTSPELVIRCPSNNETLYQSRTSSARKFLLLCDRDYSSADGATDLFNVQVDSFSDCVDRCAGNTGCMAVGWGNYQGNNTCWLKAAIGRPNSTPGWFFAVGEEILRGASARRSGV